MAILRALYVSTVLVTTEGRQAALGSILAAARMANAARDITGCLRFIEHTLMTREVKNRSFPDWRMAEVDIAAAAPELKCVDLAKAPSAVLISLLIRLSEYVGSAGSTSGAASNSFASPGGRR